MTTEGTDYSAIERRIETFIAVIGVAAAAVAALGWGRRAALGTAVGEEVAHQGAAIVGDVEHQVLAARHIAGGEGRGSRREVFRARVYALSSRRDRRAVSR